MVLCFAFFRDSLRWLRLASNLVCSWGWLWTDLLPLHMWCNCRYMPPSMPWLQILSIHAIFIYFYCHLFFFNCLYCRLPAVDSLVSGSQACAILPSLPLLVLNSASFTCWKTAVFLLDRSVFDISAWSYTSVTSSSGAFPLGLRSGKLGEQCEAVVRFPRLFQKYPFPILINSAFLKLADVFRVG